ncbi:ribonuclease D [Haloechinothrix sp. LS1_15]|uniref:ribonuclease D n=1 Tax=Haloechinothrix sp. LS1_15 TaxID=2652248 RepID=UPI002945962E|nr:ribonuclease D [Haloechinothrix sp. LS1_15]MDV6013369.1 ribonuclease D [Haloechinothrix sp. LS1_15]
MASDAGTVAVVEPHEGTPPVIEDGNALHRACDMLAAGTGPFAIDAERASGYRYWPRAYLLQLRREGAGTHLVDPIALAGSLGPLREVLADAEWVLHAASQDLPCLAELGMRPRTLFDTELAGRLAGFPRVGLAALVAELLGYRLAKGHGAADWSRRPLPAEWLTYAALDVEFLLPLRDALQEVLARDGKLAWARQEFDAVRDAEPSEQHSGRIKTSKHGTEPWRRTSGIHKVRTRRGLAIVRELWQARDELARRRDRAPGRVVPDKTIVDAALAEPRDRDELVALPGFGGQYQRKRADFWFRHIRRARELDERDLPEITPAGNHVPPPNKWADHNPDAAARLAAARAALTELAEQHTLPVENLLLPELVRTLCWEPPEGDVEPLRAALAAGGARPWQVELVSERLHEALGHTAS